MLSGVNRGRNVAEDVTYSGTVAGAMEGTVLGIPSFALSQAYVFTPQAQPHWETAMRIAPDLIRRCSTTGMPRDVLVNINFPDCPPDEVAGIAVDGAGQARPGIAAHRCAPRWARQSLLLDRFRARRHAGAAAGSDLAALNDKRISVTPLRLDLTDEPFMTQAGGIVWLDLGRSVAAGRREGVLSCSAWNGFCKPGGRDRARAGCLRHSR